MPNSLRGDSHGKTYVTFWGLANAAAQGIRLSFDTRVPSDCDAAV
jgi:hypothetical protein